MAKRKSAPKKAPARRVSPLKPGLNGARYWATAQVRAAGYSRRHRLNLIAGIVTLCVLVFGGALWLGGFVPSLQASGQRFVKHQLMGAGFVVRHVDIVGEGRIGEDEVRARLGAQAGDYLFDMNIKNAQSRVQDLGWVENAVVRRLWPDRIVVHINERRPFALWQENGNFSIIDKKGEPILGASVREFAQLPFVVGPKAAQNAAAFQTMLSGHTALQAQSYAGVFVGERRWDLILKPSRMRILLPENNPEQALARLVRYDAKYKILSRDIARIDLRIEGRMTIRPNRLEESRSIALGKNRVKRG